MFEQEEKKAAWYVVKVHNGFEKPVRAGIEQMIDIMNLGDRIFEILIPTEKRIYIKDGKRVEKEEHMYPGYVLVRMVMDDQTRHAIDSVEHVSQFLGGSRSFPESLSDEEIDSIRKRMDSGIVQHQTDHKVGDTVKVTDGPFSDLDGKISEIDQGKGQVTVLVPMFGRETPIKLDMFQIRSI